MAARTTQPQDAIGAQIRAMGARFDAEVLARTRALFEPLWPGEADMRVQTACYGEDERHRADIYAPHGAAALPVLVFVPGGGFVGGSRAGYAAFAGHLARQGLVVAVADYRLAPRHGWPAGAEDVRLVLEWAGRDIARFGGDPRRLFVFGHSAGATHVAGAIFDARLRPSNLGDVKGVVLGSGVYEVAPDEERDNVLAYFGEDRSLFAERSPLPHAPGSDADVLIFAAGLDPSVFTASGAALARALGRPLELIDGHNHVSTVFAVGTRHDVLGGMIRRYVAATSSTT